MQTTTELRLLNQTVLMADMTINQAIDVAKTPERFNEKRISSLIAHITGDTDLPKRLTAQERYYFLLNHQAINTHKYNPVTDFDSFFVPTNPDDVPRQHTMGQVVINHLLGRHAEILEAQCENVFDWLAGMMACQLSGKLSEIVGNSSLVDESLEDETDVWQWQPLNDEALVEMSDASLNEAIQARFAQISNLPIYLFNKLADTYYLGAACLNHFVEISCDNHGITLIGQSKQGGADAVSARFCALTHIKGVAGQLTTCLVE